MGLTEEARKTLYATDPPPLFVVVARNVTSRWEAVKRWFVTVMASAVPSTVAEMLHHWSCPTRPAQPNSTGCAKPGVVTKVPGHLIVSTAANIFPLPTSY